VVAVAAVPEVAVAVVVAAVVPKGNKNISQYNCI
jgi:hypothetical protein